MLDDVDCFDSEQDVVENVGIFLADCCHAKQVCLHLECTFSFFSRCETLISDRYRRLVRSFMENDG